MTEHDPCAEKAQAELREVFSRTNGGHNIHHYKSEIIVVDQKGGGSNKQTKTSLVTNKSNPKTTHNKSSVHRKGESSNLIPCETKANIPNVDIVKNLAEKSDNFLPKKKYKLRNQAYYMSGTAHIHFSR